MFTGGGLALAVAGLWRVLAAQAGTRYRLSTRHDIHRTYGTVEAYQIAVADQAIDDLDTSVCGALRSADNGQVRLAVAGNHDLITIPLNRITNLTVVATCE